MNILKHTAIDAADLIVGGAILTGIGVGAAFVVGGAPIIAAGAAISAICAGTTIAVSRVASHVFGGLLKNHPNTARCFKVIAFLGSVGAGVGAAAGAALLAPTLGITLGISLTAGAAILGSVALAATVGYVAYLALRGIHNLCKKEEPVQDNLGNLFNINNLGANHNRVIIIDDQEPNNNPVEQLLPPPLPPMPDLGEDDNELIFNHNFANKPLPNLPNVPPKPLIPPPPLPNFL